MAEGAAALVLETWNRRRRAGPGSSACSKVAGKWQIRSTAALEPDGSQIVGCIARRCRCAPGSRRDRLRQSARTGTPENDKMEFVGMSGVFGERANSQLPLEGVYDVCTLAEDTGLPTNSSCRSRGVPVAVRMT